MCISLWTHVCMYVSGCNKRLLKTDDIYWGRSISNNGGLLINYDMAWLAILTLCTFQTVTVFTNSYSVSWLSDYEAVRLSSFQAKKEQQWLTVMRKMKDSFGNWGYWVPGQRRNKIYKVIRNVITRQKINWDWWADNERKLLHLLNMIFLCFELTISNLCPLLVFRKKDLTWW